MGTFLITMDLLLPMAFGSNSPAFIICVVLTADREGYTIHVKWSASDNNRRHYSPCLFTDPTRHSCLMDP